MICQDFVVRTQQFWRITMQPHPKKSSKKVVFAVVHHISWTTARVSPSKHVGDFMGTVDVVVVVAVVHHISWAAVRPVKKYMGRLMGRAERSIQSPHLIGRSPPRPINISEDGPRPGPAHQKRQRTGRSPSQSDQIFKFALPGPAHQLFKSLGPARPITFSNVWAPPVTIFRSAQSSRAQTNDP